MHFMLALARSTSERRTTTLSSRSGRDSRSRSPSARSESMSPQSNTVQDIPVQDRTGAVQGHPLLA